MNDSEYLLAELEYWANEDVGKRFLLEAAIKRQEALLRVVNRFMKKAENK